MMKMNWKSCRALSFEKKKKRKRKERKEELKKGKDEEKKKEKFPFLLQSFLNLSFCVTLGEILFHCVEWIEMVGSTGDFTS